MSNNVNTLPFFDLLPFCHYRFIRIYIHILKLCRFSPNSVWWDWFTKIVLVSIHIGFKYSKMTQLETFWATFFTNVTDLDFEPKTHVQNLAKFDLKVCSPTRPHTLTPTNDHFCRYPYVSGYRSHRSLILKLLIF